MQIVANVINQKPLTTFFGIGRDEKNLILVREGWYPTENIAHYIYQAANVHGQTEESFKTENLLNLQSSFLDCTHMIRHYRKNFETIKQNC